MTTHDTPEAAPCEYCGGDLSDPEHFRTPLHRASTDPPVRSEQWGDGSRQSSMHLRPVTTHDTPEAALAAALSNVPTIKYVIARGGRYNGAWWDRFAAEVLAAMPDWVLMPRVATADWTGSTKRDAAEVARLSRIEAAAQAHVAWEYRMPGAPRFTLTMLRAALAKP